MTTEQKYQSTTNRNFLYLLGLHVPVVAAVAWWFETGWVFSLIAGVVFVAGPALLLGMKPASWVTSVALGMASMCFSGLLIHSGRGMIELHFHIFVMLALLIMFGDFRVLLAAAGTVAVHHLAFFMWLPASVFNYKASFGIVLVHAVFVVVQTVPSCLIAAKFRRMIMAQGIAVEKLGPLAERLQTSSGRISTTSQTLASGASQQAAALEETSSSLEEMSSMAAKTTEATREAASISKEANEAAANGQKAMTEMGDAIGKISESAKSTAKIIKAIDEIAFQTNLLALNAAVEAARAGEAGRGFAVVAEEVRNLAMRSAEAARNTTDLLEQSVKSAASGVEITSHVAEALTRINESGGKLNQLVNEISAASVEQSQGIGQVSKAVQEIDKVTQNAAGAAQELAASSEDLATRSEELGGIVTRLVQVVDGAQSSTTTAGELRQAA